MTHLAALRSARTIPNTSDRADRGCATNTDALAVSPVQIDAPGRPVRDVHGVPTAGLTCERYLPAVDHLLDRRGRPFDDERFLGRQAIVGPNRAQCFQDMNPAVGQAVVRHPCRENSSKRPQLSAIAPPVDESRDLQQGSEPFSVTYSGCPMRPAPASETVDSTTSIRVVHRGAPGSPRHLGTHRS
jgi:hypothetical protein